MKKAVLGILLALLSLGGCGWKEGQEAGWWEQNPPEERGTEERGREEEANGIWQGREDQTAKQDAQKGTSAGLSDEYGYGCLFHYGVIPVKSISTGMTGYMDVEGNWLIPPQFYDAYPFTEDGRARAAVAKEKWGVIDRAGQWVIEPEYKQLNDFHDGLAVARNGEGKYGYIDMQGNFILCEEWSIRDFCDGRAIVSSKEGVGVIDTNLEYVVPMQKEWRIDDFRNGYARVVAWDDQTTHGHNFIDVSGNFLFEEPLKDNISRGFDKWGYAKTVGGEFVDKNGQKLSFENEPNGLSYFCPGDAPEWIRTDSKFLQYVNMQGETLFTESADVPDGDWSYSKLSYGYMVIQGNQLENKFKEGMGVTRVVPQLPDSVTGQQYGEFHADGYCLVACVNSAARNRSGPDSFHVIIDTQGQVVLDLRDFDGEKVKNTGFSVDQ